MHATYHEAAHAVFAHHAGLELESVSLGPGYGGLTKLRPPKKTDALRLATVILAGNFAGPMALGVDPAPHISFAEMDDCEVSDYAKAARMITLSVEGCSDPASVSEVLYMGVLTLAEMWTNELWLQVQEVAEELRTAGRLEGEDVGRIIEAVEAKTGDAASIWEPGVAGPVRRFCVKALGASPPHLLLWRAGFLLYPARLLTI
jgi:hypothetical protein